MKTPLTTTLADAVLLAVLVSCSLATLACGGSTSPSHSTTLNATKGYRHYDQETLDKLLVTLRTDASQTREQRRELARKIDKMLMDDPPQLNFYNGAFVEAVSDRVKGYVQSFTGRRPNLRNVTLA